MPTQILGQTRESFPLLRPGSDATTVQAVAVYPGASAARIKRLVRRKAHAAAVIGNCTLSAHAPYSPYADTVEGIATHRCTGDTSHVSYLDVGACLDWWSGAKWVQQAGCKSNYTHGPWSVGVTVTHYCTPGGYHGWRTRANGHVIQNGTLYADSAAWSDWVHCV